MNFLAEISSSSSKRTIADRLLRVVYEEKLVLAVYGRPGIVSRFLWDRSEYQCQNRGIRVFYDGAIKLPNAARLMASYQWHKPKTRIFICTPLAVTILNDERLRELGMQQIEEKLRPSILLFIDPIDDDLRLYGNEDKRLLAENFSGACLDRNLDMFPRT